MEEMVTLKLPKKDIDAFLRVLEDIKFVKEAEKGDDEISRGKFKTLDDVKNKYGLH